MADHFQLNLGALRSTISLTLHTHHAARIWQGRQAATGVKYIMSMGGYIGITNTLKYAAAHDDPYADWFMIKLEEKLEEAAARMRELLGQIERIIVQFPTQVSISENLNVQPVTLPLFVGSQLGFLAIYLLTDYDILVRRTLLAHHTALISRGDAERRLDAGAHLLRSLFGLAQRCRVSGVTRDDMAANNARAREAVAKLGLPPQDILEGRRRSRYAPPIIRDGVPEDRNGSDTEQGETP